MKTLAVGESNWLSEAVLWTQWRHQGTLRAVSECQLLALDAFKFQSIVSKFPMNSVRTYAEEFVKILGTTRREELSDMGSVNPEVRWAIWIAFPNHSRNSNTSNRSRAGSKGSLGGSWFAGGGHKLSAQKLSTQRKSVESVRGSKRGSHVSRHSHGAPQMQSRRSRNSVYSQFSIESLKSTTIVTKAIHIWQWCSDTPCGMCLGECCVRLRSQMCGFRRRVSHDVCVSPAQDVVPS